MRAFFTTTLQTTTTPLSPTDTHALTPALCVCFLPDAWDLRTLEISFFYLDCDTEMSCSHAIDVDRSRARFSSMCHWTLKQNAQDVLWLPRIPGDIIIPGLSFLFFPLSTPSASPQLSPPLGLYVPLYMEYSSYSTAYHLFWLQRSCQRSDWREQFTCKYFQTLQ